MSKEFPHTFNSWIKERCGEVRLVPPDTYYESSYVIKFNYLRDREWFREGKKWIHPERKYVCKDIHQAYSCQRYEEEILKKE